MSTPMPASPLNLGSLGKASSYKDQYDPALLFAVPRADKRREIGISTSPFGSAPFFGADLWTAYELSWLNLRGKPELAIAHITIPAESPYLIESKSLKLYLASFSNTRIASSDALLQTLRADLSQAAGVAGSAGVGGVSVQLLAPAAFDAQQIFELDGLSLDRLDIECTRYTPAPDLLKVDPHGAPVEEVLTSNLLKSNCLITGQPDWGSVRIAYSGHSIDQAGLLQYLVSFRNHNEFHEQCVERIFMDVWSRCRPSKLSVYARYTRRGGIDINPFRTSHPCMLPPNVRTARQ